MPGTLGVEIKGARDLPIMDKSAETTDAFVEVRFGSISHKTEVCHKSLSPRWENENFIFEVEDVQLQDESLQLRVMDYDTYSANDAIGRIYVPLHPLVQAASTTNTAHMSGWLPIFDTINGGVIPYGHTLASVEGDVFELVSAGDPEYQWLDRIRSPRATNEARQILFRNLTSLLARKIGRKAMTLGGNAICGYKVGIDVEGEKSGLVVVRGSGTAVRLIDHSAPTVQAQAILHHYQHVYQHSHSVSGSAASENNDPNVQQAYKSGHRSSYPLARSRSASEDCNDSSHSGGGGGGGGGLQYNSGGNNSNNNSNTDGPPLPIVINSGNNSDVPSSSSSSKAAATGGSISSNSSRKNTAVSNNNYNNTIIISSSIENGGGVESFPPPSLSSTIGATNGAPPSSTPTMAPLFGPASYDSSNNSTDPLMTQQSNSTPNSSLPTSARATGRKMSRQQQGRKDTNASLQIRQVLRRDPYD